jgi:cytochrome c
MKGIAAGLGLASVALMGWGIGMGTGTVQAAGQQDEAAQPQFYVTKVQPILQKNCYQCHGGVAHRGGLSLQTRAGMLKGGHDGPVLVPGDPTSSLLVRLIRHEGPEKDPMPMPPPPKPKVSDDDIAIVTQWVKAGAVMPEEVATP